MSDRALPSQDIIKENEIQIVTKLDPNSEIFVHRNSQLILALSRKVCRPSAPGNMKLLICWAQQKASEALVPEVVCACVRTKDEAPLEQPREASARPCLLVCLLPGEEGELNRTGLVSSLAFPLFFYFFLAYVCVCAGQPKERTADPA